MPYANICSVMHGFIDPEAGFTEDKELQLCNFVDIKYFVKSFVVCLINIQRVLIFALRVHKGSGIVSWKKLEATSYK